MRHIPWPYVALFVIVILNYAREKITKWNSFSARLSSTWSPWLLDCTSSMPSHA